MGAVLHTLNLRLGPSDLGYIIEHAKDRATLQREREVCWQHAPGRHKMLQELAAARDAGNEKWNDPEKNHPTFGFL